MNNRETKIVRSPLSQRVSDGDITVDVEIYRLEGETGWAMELVEADGSSITWDELFVSDEEALAFFREGVRQMGLEAFLQPEDDEEEPTVH